MRTDIEVVPYCIADLKRILRERSRATEPAIDRKLHTHYFDEYFDELAAKTIVVEPEYIDRDYLEDLAGYYVKCFQRYERKCTRLHFFSAGFSLGDLTALLEGRPGRVSARALQKSYLGFIVVKPLPRTFVGRTCLKTYPAGKRRRFPVVRTYDANLFGLPLQVQTLAFQEQDSEVAQCATSALWSALHGTGVTFQHRIPTPVEITKAATDNEPSDSRNLPATGGLSPSKIARAIRSVGLEPFYVSAKNSDVVRATTYAYLAGGVPLILGAALFDGADGTALTEKGKHAVAVTGFSLGIRAPVPRGPHGFLLEASRIDKLYAHDDQVGPFARMVFDGNEHQFKFSETHIRANWSLRTSWVRDNGTLGTRAIPIMMIAPLYHKIRIPYDAIESIVFTFDALTSTAGRSLERAVWDIRLAVASRLKAEIAAEGILQGSERRTFLQRPLPRFLWRATARVRGQPVLDLLFDATDIQQGELLAHVIVYDESRAVVARQVARRFKDAVALEPVRHVLAWFEDHPRAASTHKRSSSARSSKPA